MFPQHHGLKATYSYQNPGFQADSHGKKPSYRRAFSDNGYSTLEGEEEQPQTETKLTPISSSSSSVPHVSIPISEPTVPIIHREIKSGRQRLRWNLIFNVLVWIICPLPFWLPFLSNQVAVYLLPSIQAVFVFIWLVISLLAARNAFIIFRCVKNLFFLSYFSFN